MGNCNKPEKPLEDLECQNPEENKEFENDNLKLQDDCSPEEAEMYKAMNLTAPKSGVHAQPIDPLVNPNPIQITYTPSEENGEKIIQRIIPNEATLPVSTIDPMINQQLPLIQTFEPQPLEMPNESNIETTNLRLSGLPPEWYAEGDIRSSYQYMIKHLGKNY